MTLPRPTPATGGRTGTAAHRQTGFVEFDAFAVTQYRHPSIDVELRDRSVEARVDFVCGNQRSSTSLNFFGTTIFSRRKLFESSHRL